MVYIPYMVIFPTRQYIYIRVCIIIRILLHYILLYCIISHYTCLFYNIALLYITCDFIVFYYHIHFFCHSTCFQICWYIKDVLHYILSVYVLFSYI